VNEVGPALRSCLEKAHACLLADDPIAAADHLDAAERCWSQPGAHVAEPAPLLALVKACQTVGRRVETSIGEKLSRLSAAGHAARAYIGATE
jgi:hypothetical protein